MMDIQKLYSQRFIDTGLEKRDRVWKILCERFFDPLINPESTVLDLGCGYGEFINNVRCKHKLAVDLNPDIAAGLDQCVKFYKLFVSKLHERATESVNLVFTSYVLYHLATK